MGKDDKKTISIAKTDIEVDDSEDFMAFSEAEIEAINEEIKGRDQGYGLDLGERIRLGASDMSQLHDVLTGKLCEGMQLEQPSVMYLNFQDQITKDPRFKLDASKQGNYSKMSSVKVVVEQTSNGRVLVKVGPHDLSGVGGAQVRERIVTDLVNQALAQQGIHKSYKDVDVSANLGVRGRMQMLLGLFTRNDPGSHQNAYIKVAGEEHFTRWEPRKGPQSFFNDTICAMATTVSRCR